MASISVGVHTTENTKPLSIPDALKSGLCVLVADVFVGNQLTVEEVDQIDAIDAVLAQVRAPLFLVPLYIHLHLPANGMGWQEWAAAHRYPSRRLLPAPPRAFIDFIRG